MSVDFHFRILNFQMRGKPFFLTIRKHPHQLFLSKKSSEKQHISCYAIFYSTKNDQNYHFNRSEIPGGFGSTSSGTARCWGTSPVIVIVLMGSFGRKRKTKTKTIVLLIFGTPAVLFW